MAKMRLKARFAVLLVCLLMLAAGYAVAQEEKVQGVGLDVVIVLDCSRSMNEKDEGGRSLSTSNDAEYYRLDAASIMINMCEVQDSRVAIVPFNRRLVEGSLWNRLIPIGLKDGYAMREGLSRAVIDMHDVDGGTDLYIAMQKANELLLAAQEEGSTNKPVILVLCDGAVGLGTSDAQSFYGATPDEAAKIMRAGIEKEIAVASDNEFKIYTVALCYGNQTYDTSLLQKMREDTGVVAALPTPRNAVELPSIFSEIFAEAVGSMLQPVEPKQVEGNVYEIPVSIPNASVMEANILIPVDMVEGSATVYNPRGEVETDQEKVLIFEYDNQAPAQVNRRQFKFIQIKIISPESGEWNIKFNKAEGEQTELSFDMLYNYGIQLSATALPAQMHRNDPLHIEAYFIDEQGDRSKDLALYQNGIQAYVTVKKDGETVAELKDVLMTRELDCFVLEADQVRELGLEDVGEYSIAIHAEGDYLFRSLPEPLVFTLENREPTVAKALEGQALVIEDMLREDPYAPDTAEVSFAGVFADSDKDALKYTVSGSAVDEVVSARIEGETLYLETNSNVGEGEIILTATDPDGKMAEARFAVQVTSWPQSTQASMGMRLYEAAENPSPRQKDSDMVLCAELYSIETGERISDAALLMAANAQLHIARDKYEESDPPLLMTYDEAADALVATLRTAPQSDRYIATLQMGVGDFAFDETALDFEVTDPAPVVNADVLREIPVEYWVQSDGRGAYTVELAKLFTDSPGDTLTYAAAFDGGEAVDIVLDRERETVTITPVARGNGNLRITATDTDEQTTEAVISLAVRSQLYETIRLVLLVLAGAVVVALIIWAVYMFGYRKAWPRPNNAVEYYINNMPKGDGKLYRKGRKAHKLKAFFSFGDQLEREQRSKVMTVLGGITLYPISRGRIHVKVDKLDRGVRVRVGSQTLTEKNKTALWLDATELEVVVDDITLLWKRKAIINSGRKYHAGSK